MKVYLSAFNGNFSNIIDLLVKYEEQISISVMHKAGLLFKWQ